jgi:hypothetical protein
MPTPLTPRRVAFARVLAMLVDLAQIVLLPAFFPGVASPVNSVIDVATAVAMIAIVGWHWAFLPTFLLELVPLVDLVPTWTAAVFIATRGHGRGDAPGEEGALPGPPPGRLGPGQESDSGS